MDSPHDKSPGDADRSRAVRDEPPPAPAPHPDLRRRRGYRLLPAGRQPFGRRGAARVARLRRPGGERDPDRLHGGDLPAGAARRPAAAPPVPRHPARPHRRRSAGRGVRAGAGAADRRGGRRRHDHRGRAGHRSAGGGSGGRRPPGSRTGHPAERFDGRHAVGPHLRRDAGRTAGVAGPLPGGRGRGSAARDGPGPHPAGHRPDLASAVRSLAGRAAAPAAGRAGTAPLLPLPGDGLRRLLGRLDLPGAAAHRPRVRPGRACGGGARPGGRGDHAVHPVRRASGGPDGTGPGEPRLPAGGPAVGRGPRRGRRGWAGGSRRAGGRDAAAGRLDAVRHARQPGPGVRPAPRCPQPAQHRLHDLRVPGRQRRILARRAGLRQRRLAGGVRARGRPGRDRPGMPSAGAARTRRLSKQPVGRRAR